MKNLKRLSFTVVLTFVLGLTTFAGEMPTPPCSTNPGETNTPPCSTSMTYEEPTALGQIDTPPASESTSIFSLAVQTALDLLLF